MSKQTDELVKLTYEIHSRALVLHQTLSDSGSLRKEENAIQMNKNPELASILSAIKFPVRHDGECISDSCLHICGYHIAIEWGDAFDTKEKQDAFGEELARLINTLDPNREDRSGVALKVMDVKTGVVHPIRKLIVGGDQEISIWCNTWYGRHVIGGDCEFVNVDPNRESVKMKDGSKTNLD